jgi:hypothetical protein
MPLAFWLEAYFVMYYVRYPDNFKGQEILLEFTPDDLNFTDSFTLKDARPTLE